MNFDIRLPLGLLFGVLGAILAVFGLVTESDPIIYAKSLHRNVNLEWGIVMMLFASVMLLLAWRGHRKTTTLPKE